ncbi:glycoside hydrolase family 5 protein [Chytriomyces sp. MP71]|nr:glycoside hydrolase family 5 protein [Chytriomyces sp. MP71]
MWAGVNSYFLYSLPESDQETILSALADAGVKTVRIFLTSFSPGGKGTTARGSTDLELDTCGDYNDSVLDQVDAMLPLLSKHGIRLLIAMHDRWNLDGTWGICDAYCQKYMGGSGKDLRAFYASEEAQAQFDKRLAHVARYESKTMGGRAWMDLPEVIYALEIQNEGQGTSNGIDQFSNPDWWCGRATALRAVMGDSQVKISTGGGQDFGHSILDNNFACKALDVIALHSYESDMGTIQKNLADAQNKAQAQGQVIIFEEFGVQGGKADFIAKVGALANSMGIPWMPWEVSNPSAKSDYEFWMDDSETWSALTKYAKAAVGSY